MTAPIEFWFDFSSPYGHLAAQRIEALAARHGRTVDWRPILLGVVFKVAGTAPLTEIPLKGEYSKRDFARSARFHGVGDFRMPSRFPIATQAAARILLWAKSTTLGALAAAIGAGRLLALDEAQLVHAIALAASQAAGLRANFGTDAKPLHAGLAARAGVQSAQLAQAGLTGAAGSIDGTAGFLALYGDRDAGTPALATAAAPGATALEILRTGITLKQHACCGQTHCAVDALLALVRAHAVRADEVVAIDCVVNRMATEVLVHAQAGTPLEAKFCMAYCLAVALLDRACGLAQFTAERVAAPDVQSVARRVRVTIDERLAPGLSPARVALALRDGRTLAHAVQRARGTPEDPLAEADVERKFHDCASPVLGRARAGQAYRLLAALPSLTDVRELARAVAVTG